MTKRIYLVDLDGTAVEPGWPTHWKPGAIDKLRAMAQQGEIWFFSCWAFGPEHIAFLSTLGIPFGFIGKPLADEYIYIDDKLNVALCGTAL